MTVHETSFDLVDHLHRQRRFSEKTFGPGARTDGVIDHIRKELREIRKAPADLDEWIDVVLLALDGAWRAGHPPEAIAAALAAKQARNESRSWPDWRDQPADKAIEHDRGDTRPTMLDPDDMPEPDALVAYDDGSIAAAMFHYLPDGISFRAVAMDNGFAFRTITMDVDLPPDHELLDAYEEGDERVLLQWQPSPPEGWSLAARIDSENGLMAAFIRPLDETVAAADPLPLKGRGREGVSTAC